MKKLILIILLIIVLLIISAVALLFTPAGSNSFIKPLMNSYLGKQIEHPKVEVTKLDSKFGSIDLKAVADNGIALASSGEVDYLSQKFDQNYQINAASVKVDNRDIKMDLDVKGQAVGSVKNFGVNGVGRAFDSDINYKFIIKDGNPQTITASLNSAQIAKIFALANMQPLADGYLFVDSNIPSLDAKNPHGTAHIEVKDGRLNNRILSKEYGITLPEDEKFIANIDAKVNKNHILARGDINSTTAKIKIKKLTSSLDFNILKAYFRLTIADLSRVAAVAKIPLQGSAVIDGAFYKNFKRNITQVVATSKSLGGLSRVNLNNKELKVNLQKISIPKVLHTLKQPLFVSKGSLSGNVFLKDYSKLNGNFKVASSGTLNKKLLKIALPSYSYTIKSEGSLKDATLTAKKTNIISHFVNATFSNTRYALLTNAVDSDYSIYVKDLAGFNAISPQKMAGELKISGRLKNQGTFTTATFKTASLGGKLSGEYSSKSLSAKFNNLSLPKVLHMFQMPHIFTKGAATGNIRVTNLQKGNGLFTLQSKGGFDTATLQKLTNLQFTPPFNYSMLIKNGVIKDNRVLTKPQLLTSYGKFNFDYLNYDIDRKALSSKFGVEISDLSKFNSLTGQKLQGRFAINATIKQDPNNLLLSASAKELDGVINYMQKNNKINIDAAGISVVKLLKMLSYNQVLDGVAITNVNYNSKTQKGDYKITLNEARFLNSPLVDALKNAANFDLAQEVFSRATLHGTIDKGQILLNLNTSSKRTKITINQGIIDTKKSTIDARVAVTFNNQEYPFHLSGPLSQPKVSLIFGGAIKKGVIKRVKKAILGKDANKTLNKIIPNELKDKNIQDQIKKVVPKEIKGLFENL
jgi:hypothetical protein